MVSEAALCPLPPTYLALQVYRKIHACALELLAKLGHSYVISTLSREPLFSISEDREVVCKEGVLPLLFCGKSVTCLLCKACMCHAPDGRCRHVES